MTFFKLLLSALILISACPGYAGEAEWKQHIDAGLSASRQKDWGRAKSQFEEALLAANGNERLSALASIHLGRALQAMKQFESAAHQFRLAVATLEKTGSSDTDSLATAIHQLAFTLASVKEYAEAESLQKRAISLTKTLYGPTDLDVGSREQELGWIYLNWKKYDEAAFAFSRALSIADASSVEKPEFVRQIVVALALVHSYRKDKVAVREYGRRQLKLGERLYGVRSAEVAQDLLDIGFRHDLQGDFEESEASYKRAIQILTTLSLPQNIMRIAALKQLGLLYSGQSRFADAEAVYENANREAKATLGDRHPTTISILRSLSSVYLARGKFDDAARLLDQLQEFEAGLGKNIDELIREITMLSLVRVGQGRYAEAEKGFRSAILLIETARGPDDPELSGLLIMFAYSIGLRGGSLVDVEALDRRALAITEKTVGRNSDAYADRLADLARARQAVGKYEEAEALLLNAVSVKSKLFGENHLKFGPVFSALSSVYVDLGKFKFAAEYATRAVNVLEMGQTTNQLGLARALLAQTAPLLELQYFESSANAAARALAIFNSLLGSAHVETAFSRYRLAAAQAAEGRVAESLETVRLASSAMSDWRNDNNDVSVSDFYDVHLAILSKALGNDQRNRAALVNEAFKIGQLSRTSNTAKQIQRMAVRFASGSDRLAELIRQHQDVVAHSNQLDDQLVEFMSRPALQRSMALETRLREMHAASLLRRDALRKTVDSEFPRYQELTTTRPIDLSKTQRLLNVDEALVSFFLGKKESFVFVVRHDGSAFHRLPISKEQVSELVKSLRIQLDLGGNLVEVLGRPFDFATASKLYFALFGTIEGMVQSASRLIVVPDGPLQSLPFGVLVTDSKIPETATSAAWLIKRHAITILPSISSLEALRASRTGNYGSETFGGFGNPTLAHSGQIRNTVNADLFSRGAIANVDDIRKLPSLPETETELRAIAKTLGASAGSLFLQNNATESKVKSMDLSRFRRLAFATHGLMAGDFKGVQEPALVLTPPKEGSAFDDGLLTASEVAQLKLNADWVILSACNTAAPDGTPGAEGLSGLAKAFFYAGARSLLVSHWSIESDAAVELTTRMFAEIDKGFSKAEALRRSMLALMANKNTSHPAFWAPFVVVGDGR